MQLDALEQLIPFEVRQAGKVLAYLQNAWRSATPDEQREICSIILGNFGRTASLRDGA